MGTKYAGQLSAPNPAGWAHADVSGAVAAPALMQPSRVSEALHRHVLGNKRLGCCRLLGLAVAPAGSADPSQACALEDTPGNTFAYTGLWSKTS
eukprot:1155118-Pelagomonas_calceolata.AAC.3